MNFFHILLVLAGIILIQKLSGLFPLNRIVVMSFFQISYSLVVFAILRVSYTFQINLKGFLSFFIIFTIMILLGNLLKASQMRIYKKISLQEFLTLGIVLPFSEELIFRGVILFLVPNSLVNATIFSLVHGVNIFSKIESFSIFNFVYRFVVGYIFANSVLKTQSLFSAVVCHIINNLVGLLILSRSEHIPKKSTDTAERKNSEK